MSGTAAGGLKIVNIDAVHAEIVAAARAALPLRSSALRNTVSVHTCASPVQFGAVGRFHAAVEHLRRRGAVRAPHLGVVDGEVVLSVRLVRHTDAAPASAPAPPPLPLPSGPAPRWFGGSKKRKRSGDDNNNNNNAEGRAEAAVRAVRARARADDPRLDASIELAKTTITRLLSSVRGAGGEAVLEACALTMQDRTAARPNLILACRFCAGVAVPLDSMRNAMEHCFEDGLFTTKLDNLTPEFQLSTSEFGRELEAHGQPGLLCFASVKSAD